MRRRSAVIRHCVSSPTNGWQSTRGAGVGRRSAGWRNKRACLVQRRRSRSTRAVISAIRASERPVGRLRSVRVSKCTPVRHGATNSHFCSQLSSLTCILIMACYLAGYIPEALSTSRTIAKYH